MSEALRLSDIDVIKLHTIRNVNKLVCVQYLGSNQETVECSGCDYSEHYRDLVKLCPKLRVAPVVFGCH